MSNGSGQPSAASSNSIKSLGSRNHAGSQGNQTKPQRISESDETTSGAKESGDAQAQVRSGSDAATAHTTSQSHQQQQSQEFTLNDDEYDDEDDNGDDQFLNEDEFHDAVEDVTQFSVTLPRHQKNGAFLHHRNPSNISKLYLQESENSSDDEDQQTIKVTMHNANKDQGWGFFAVVFHAVIKLVYF